jgi:hypothetical protein
MATREQVLEAVSRTIRVRHFSLRTEEAYCHWIGRFYDFARRLPQDWTSERKVEGFISDLALRQNVAASQTRAREDCNTAATTKRGRAE